MKNILITGANGQLGSEIKAIERLFPHFNLIYTDVDELDITIETAVENILSEQNIHTIVNCAAYTAVDKAEDEPELAAKVNVKGPEVLSKISNNKNVNFIHVSTDYVFDGKNFKPYTESDPTKPLGIYGKTKLEGEIAVLANNPQAFIIRTSWLYSVFGNNFVKTMLRLMKEREELGVIFDQVGTPTNAADLASVIMQILSNSIKNGKGEIYHYSNEGAISWFDFAMAIKELSGSYCNVKPIHSYEFNFKATRPFYSVLDKQKIKDTFGVEIPYWKDSLKKCLERMEQWRVNSKQ